MKRLPLLLAAVLIASFPGVGRAAVGAELNGLASFGVSAGLFRWWADKDARSFQGEAASVRPIGKAVFRYRVNTNWLVSLESGFAWSGYPESNDVTTWVIPSTIGVERRLRDLWGMTTSFCLGGGAYVWGRWEKGHTMLDPVTSHPLHALDPGGYAGLSGEFHASEHVTCTTHLTAHGILSTHQDEFKGTLGGSKMFTDLRFGVNYYFSPYEGLIW